MAASVVQALPVQAGELAVAVDVPLPSDWSVSERQLCDLEMILSGAFAPLTGFMGIEDYKRCGTLSFFVKAHPMSKHSPRA